MKISKYLGIALILIPFSPISAQKAVDKRVNINYVHLPTDILPPEYTTYSVRVYGANVSTSGLGADHLSRYIKMDGFKRVGSSPTEFGHLRVSVNTGYTTTGKPEYKTLTTTSKDSKGVVTKSTTYWYEIACSASTSYSITDPDGSVLASGSKSHSDNIKSKSYSSSSELTKAYSGIVSGIRRNFSKNVANTAVSMAQQALRSKYDFAFTHDDPQLFWIKKHPQENIFETHLEKTIELCKSYKASTPASDMLKDLQPIMDFWKKYADQDPGTDKTLMEIYTAMNFNLSVMSFYTDQFDAADQYAKRILKVDAKDKHTLKWIDAMNDYKSAMQKHGLLTTHYFRDLTDAVPPSKVKQLEEEKAQLGEDNNTMDGYIVVKGDSIFGTYSRSKGDEEFKFGPQGNTKFMIETADGMKDQDLLGQDVTAFQIGDREFRKMSFAPASKGKPEKGQHILETLYRSEKVTLYKYYPSSGVIANEPYEYAFQKKGESELVSLLDTRYLILDKGLANYFNDCADLHELCTKGTFKLNEPDLVKAARVYAEVCE